VILLRHTAKGSCLNITLKAKYILLNYKRLKRNHFNNPKKLNIH